MSTNRWDPKAINPPRGFNKLALVISTMENELRDKVRESNAGKRAQLKKKLEPRASVETIESRLEEE